jgi:P27 family predicted phage terminase small subunit
MGTRGRKPKPTAIKILEGKPGHRPLNEAEPQPDAADVRVPKGKLPKEGRDLWRSLAPQLSDLGVLKATDLPALEMLCLHYALARRAWKIVDAEGPTVESANATGTGTVIKKHPAASVFRENAMAVKGWATEFGLTPSSRVRIKAEPAAKEKTLAELLFEGVAGEGTDDD